MPIQTLKENYSGEINTITIGATKEEGGSSSLALKIGGEKSLPCLFKEGPLPNRPQVAFEIWDIYPKEWPQAILKEFGSALDDPFAWAEKCIKDYNAKLLCLKLQGGHPDFGDKSPEQEIKLAKEIFQQFKIPMIILGCQDEEKDRKILPGCAKALENERLLIGSAVQDNYKDLAAALSSTTHSLIAESPIDVNIAKQLNILIADEGFPLQRIVINPTIGALGYGLEYAYSIMERARLAALSGDKTLASPFICFVGQEVSKAKEAKTEDFNQAILWEAITAVALIHSGANLLVMRHPEAANRVNGYIEKIFNSL